MGETIRIHRFLERTRAEGPGLRSCIWVQGCSLRCEGCAVPFTWSSAGGTVMETIELADRILANEDVQGVTFVGGEPFEQAGPLAEIGAAVRDKGLSVMTFTGFILEDIKQANTPDWNALLSVTDLLIDGRYNRDLPENARPWAGSTNQRFHFLTPRYAHLKNHLDVVRNRLEIHVHPNGSVLVNGMAPPEVLSLFQ